MEFNLINIISIISIFQALLFAIYLITNNPKGHASNFFMAVFLIVIAIDFGASFSGYYVYPVAPNLGMFLSMTIYLGSPALFLYIKSSLYTDFRLKRADLLHLLPFCIINLSFFPFYYLTNMIGDSVIPNSNQIIRSYLIPLNYILLHIQIIAYLIASYILLRHYRKLFLENYSDAASSKYNYLFQLILILVITNVITIVKNYALFNIEGPLYEYSLHMVNLGALFVICWMVFKALKSPELFTGVSSDMQTARDILRGDNNGKSFKIEYDDQTEARIQKVQSHMEESNAYLDASLSLEALAAQMGLPAKELSLVINHNLGLHFFDFVNEYRINHAKEILSDDARKELTVLEILYEVGFNSKSSFNTEFKKRTGLTPTEYRRKH